MWITAVVCFIIWWNFNRDQNKSKLLELWYSMERCQAKILVPLKTLNLSNKTPSLCSKPNASPWVSVSMPNSITKIIYKFSPYPKTGSRLTLEIHSSHRSDARSLTSPSTVQRFYLPPRRRFVGSNDVSSCLRFLLSGIPVSSAMPPGMPSLLS